MSVDNHLIYTSQLNIASYVTKTQALGPGTRAVVWTQGCPFRCPGCVAPDWIELKEANLYTPEELVARLRIEEVDGLTFSGGEPMMQAAGLALLAKLCRQQKDVSLICFTGFRYERLVENPPNPGVKDLLAEIDVLIDGPYVQSKNNSVGLRGSTNQRILHLTNRLQHCELETQKRKIEVKVSDGELAVIGIPTPGIKSALDLTSMTVMERKFENERL